MIETRIKTLVDYIKTKIPVFSDSGYLVNPYKDSETGFKGVDDSIPNYFFIQLKKNNRPNEYGYEPLDSEGMYEVTSNLILVAGMQCPILESAVEAIGSALVYNPDFTVVINNSSTISENIYSELYNKDYKREDQLIYFDFTITYHLEFNPYCNYDICGECCK